MKAVSHLLAAAVLAAAGPGLALAANMPHAAASAAPAQAAAKAGLPRISAAEIVARNAQARGGIEAWKKIERMAWVGHTELGSSRGREFPFMLEQARPNKTHFELIVDGQKSVRIFDGGEGWKVKLKNGRPDVQPYSEDELRFARGAQAISGPLMDLAEHGAMIELAGSDQLDERPAYVLAIKVPSGLAQRIWVDAENFLELRHDRQQRGKDGKDSTISVRFRDYHEFQGLMIATTIETNGGPAGPADKLVIEKVALNPELDDQQFARPMVPVSRRRGVVVDTRSAAIQRPATPATEAPRE